MTACVRPFCDLAKASLSADRPWSCQTKQKKTFLSARKKSFYYLSPRQTRGERVPSLWSNRGSASRTTACSAERVRRGTLSRVIPMLQNYHLPICARGRAHRKLSDAQASSRGFARQSDQSETTLCSPSSGGGLFLCPNRQAGLRSAAHQTRTLDRIRLRPDLSLRPFPHLPQQPRGCCPWTRSRAHDGVRAPVPRSVQT